MYFFIVVFVGEMLLSADGCFQNLLAFASLSAMLVSKISQLPSGTPQPQSPGSILLGSSGHKSGCMP
jgi:hypothetical protein